ncbi:MAG: hypothetical protein ACTSVE_10880 [Candidatus Helarchaeota archaeon]
MEELKKEEAKLLVRREELLNELNKLKESSNRGEISATEYLKKFDKNSDSLKEIQERIKAIQQKKKEIIKNVKLEEKKKKDLEKKRELFLKLINYANKKFINTDELLDFIFQAFDIELNNLSENLNDDILDIFPLEELRNANEYLDQYIEQVISIEEIKSREEKFKNEEEERKKKQKELEIEQKRKLKEEREKQKELERMESEKKKKLNELEKQKEKLEKEIPTEEIIKILDKNKDRKKEIKQAQNSKGFIDRWALMHAISPITKKPYLYFTELELIVKEHPNYIHKTIRSYFENFGYRIENETLPLPNEIQVQDKINKVFNFTAYLKGTLVTEKEKVKGFASLYLIEEGFCTFSYGPKKPSVFCKMKISIAGEIDKMAPEDLKGDIGSIIEKLKIFKASNDNDEGLH